MLSLLWEYGNIWSKGKKGTKYSVFSSLIFVWLFLPIVFIRYFIVPRKNIFLLCSSLLFYAWGEPKYILIMICSIIMNYLI
ncbi:MAG: hypothetical protein K2P63_00150, partial [Lachnospiraceae bacterium]|nr:hypothetical protein [Lachnospiraceae bacterium]